MYTIFLIIGIEISEGGAMLLTIATLGIISWIIKKIKKKAP